MRGSLPSRQIIDALERSLGIPFRDKDLLALALIHRSFLNENPELGSESNERLEFLGDAVVDFAVGYRMFQAAPDVNEGTLTAMRAEVVRRDTLAKASARMGLGEYLVMGRGEMSSGGADRLSNLADVFEAIAGALFLDQGFDVASAFVVRSLDDEIQRALQSETPKDPKSRLQELVQATGGEPPKYRLTSSDGPDHARLFTVDVLVGGAVVAAGSGRRKLDAERAAALTALAEMLSDDRADEVRPPAV